MARGKPLTGFLLALVHSPEMTAAFNDPERRPALLEKWGLGEHELFAGQNDPTLTQIRDAVTAEQQGDDESEGESLLGGGGDPSGQTVDVAWWIWFFGDPS